MLLKQPLNLLQSQDYYHENKTKKIHSRTMYQLPYQIKKSNKVDNENLLPVQIFF